MAGLRQAGLSWNAAAFFDAREFPANQKAPATGFCPCGRRPCVVGAPLAFPGDLAFPGNGPKSVSGKRHGAPGPSSLGGVPGRLPLSLFRLVGGDGIIILQSDADVVQAFEEPLAAVRIDLKGDDPSRVVPDLALFEIDGELVTLVGLHLLKELLDR